MQYCSCGESWAFGKWELLGGLGVALPQGVVGTGQLKGLGMGQPLHVQVGWAHWRWSLGRAHTAPLWPSRPSVAGGVCHHLGHSASGFWFSLWLSFVSTEFSR